MTLILYIRLYITWLPFVYPFSHHLSRLACDVTSVLRHFSNAAMADYAHIFRANFLIKLNAPDDLLSR